MSNNISLNEPENLEDEEWQMSQDGVSWDESNNLDLRKIASPNFQTPRFMLETPASEESTSSKRTTHPKKEDETQHLERLVQNEPTPKQEKNTDALNDRKRRRLGAFTSNENDLCLNARTSNHSPRQPGKQPEKLSTVSDEFEALLERVKTPSPKEKLALLASSLPTSRNTVINSAAWNATQPHRKIQECVDGGLSANNPNNSKVSIVNVQRTATTQQSLTHPVKPFADATTAIQLQKTLQKSIRIFNTYSKNKRPYQSTQPAADLPERVGLPSALTAPHNSTTFVQPTPMSSPTQPMSQRMQNDDEDEFGDLDFTMDDIALLDSMVDQATTQLKPTSAAVPTTLQHNVGDVGDEFGDFPDMDFDALGLSITAASQRNHAPINIQRTDPITVRNQRSKRTSSEIMHLTFTRYQIVHVHDDVPTFTKTLAVARWRSEMLHENDGRALHHTDPVTGRFRAPKQRTEWRVDGELYLRGESYHTRVATGDIVHVCSLAGMYRTDVLPLLLQTSNDDDLVLIVHPDLLLTPTAISEALDCTRRAVLKNRLGSTGLRAKAALFGTMRHSLFEETLKGKDFSLDTARKHVANIVRANAEGLIACGLTSNEAELEIIKFLPQLQAFAGKFTALDGKPVDDPNVLPFLEPSGTLAPIQFYVEAVDAIEEPVISPELGLKGNIDMVVKAVTASSLHSSARTERSLISVELKTGHNQTTQNAHKAQLSLYTIMLQSRHGLMRPGSSSSKKGAKRDGMLLYMNNESVRVVHVLPTIGEIKSLIGQRNVVAVETLRSASPRGIVLTYQKQDALNNDAK
jgi:hypothetical protein